MPQSSSKRAVFIDIDGTLITDNFTPPEKNISAIEKARKNGHKIFINTGRSWGNIPEELHRYFSSLDGVISGNGSHIVLDGKVIYSVPFAFELLREISEFFFAKKGRTCLFEGVNKIVSLDNGVGFFENYQDILVSMDEFDEKLRGEPVSTLAISGVDIDEFKARFGDRVTVFQFKYFSDCVMGGCNKANGMDILLDAVGIPLERSIAIGDSMNDLPMLEHAEIGIAMGNAVDELKIAADLIVDTNFNCGVAEALEKYLG